MKLLVVDDDSGVVEMLRDYFALRSFEVLTAGTAVEALQVAFQERPDIVILDLVLPDFSGEEVLRRVKKSFPEVHVLILTGQTDPGLEPRLRRLGCDSFLAKGTPLRNLESVLLGWTR